MTEVVGRFAPSPSGRMHLGNVFAALLAWLSVKSRDGAMVLRIGVEGRTKRRLVEMGLTPGTIITISKRAPLGDPIEISLRGYELTLRKEDAAKIEVTTD